MRYLGSKIKLLSAIEEVIAENEIEGETFADLSAGEIKSSTMATLPAEIKYRLNVSRQEYLKIVEDYDAAIKQINDELKKR